jgi:predicted nuclease of predicted toxin-antitoxin system
MYLLVDECCPKCLLRCCSALGHTAQRSVEVHALGKGASDLEIFRFAVRNGAVLVTENNEDFIALGRGRRHPGMILLPAVKPRAQARLLRDIITKVAMPIFHGSFPSRFIEGLSDGSIVSFR